MTARGAPSTTPRLATGLPFHDTQCGFKAFRIAVCRRILESATVDSFGFDVEPSSVCTAPASGWRKFWRHCGTWRAARCACHATVREAGQISSPRSGRCGPAITILRCARRRVCAERPPRNPLSAVTSVNSATWADRRATGEGSCFPLTPAHRSLLNRVSPSCARRLPIRELRGKGRPRDTDERGPFRAP